MPAGDIMDPDVIRLLEFPTVRRILAGFTSTAPGRELALGLEPLATGEEVEAALTQTDEMVRASAREFRTPLGAVQDVRAAVEQAAAGGGPLEGRILLHVSILCETAGNVGAALERLEGAYPSLAAIGRRLPRLPALEQRIRRAVDSAGKVRDDATPRLKELRAEIERLRRRLEDTLDSLVHDPDLSKHLRYPHPSIYRDRYVLAVDAYHKGTLPGIVHGTSDSGATVYVEPMATIELGNALSEAIGREEEEVRAVLWDLTRHVGYERDRLLDAQCLLAGVDLLVAKARMAKRYAMTRPITGRGRVLELQEARHPILLWLTEGRDQADRPPAEPDFDAVVPTSLHLGEDFRVLVVTGPNMGGKTVTLKTVGLLCLMARAGLFVPARRAVTPLYRGIYADIGDEQSLEQSLSTFSSHMSRIVRILGEADEQGLVLLDELGAGTDPLEGAALGEAILSHLVRRGCAAVVTTHLGQLKTFAAARPEVENACVEFDPVTLRPTYRLTVGTAGSSNALEIAERLGMSRALIAEAHRRLDEVSGGAYGRMLAHVQQATEDSERRRRRVRWLEEEAERLRDEYRERLRRVKDEQERTGANIGLKIRQDLESLQKEAARLYDEVRFSHKSLARKVREIRDGLQRALERTEELLAGRELPRPIQSGDEVYVTKVHKWGRVERVDEPRRRALVTVGDMQMEVSLADLVPWGATTE